LPIPRCCRDGILVSEAGLRRHVAKVLNEMTGDVLDCFEWLGPVDKVADHGDAIHALLFHIRRHSFWRGQVSMDISQDS
jgi:hypothetical protein